ncbi:Glutamyl-tRNA amidotransferase B subunit [Gautieria morchelliformis]|nr:Glutamyl-tRNA amidotransferase B subunit [Gautieria morchelliformis]
MLLLSSQRKVFRYAALKRTISSANAFDSRWPGWNVVIGIEVHAQIKSRWKLLSGSPTPRVADSPNTRVSVFDAAWPGTLPRLNPKCVELAVRTALACGSQVQPRSAFDRKHYFYADLPAGYQITQRYAPLALGGQIVLDDTTGAKAVGIEQIQLEQDTAKSTLDQSGSTAIDLNRAGSALMEIISRPEMRSPEEAGAYVKALQAILRAVGSSDGNMEQGSFRCDVNVSVNRPGQTFGTRCEVKNLNSVKFLMTAITSEVYRHIELRDKGDPVRQETRGFDEDRMVTYRLRSKEDTPDYRYMPDPNLPPLLLSQAYLNQVMASLPELPNTLRKRLREQYGLSQQDIDVLLSVDSGKDVPYDGEKGYSAVSYFETTAQGRDPKAVVNWMVNELLAQLTHHKKFFSQNPVTEAQLGALIDMVNDRKLTGTAAKEILRHIVRTGSEDDIPTIQQSLQLGVLSDDDIYKLCLAGAEELPEEAELVRRGNSRVLMKLVGRVMKLSRGRADAQQIRKYLADDILKPKDVR